MTIPSHGVLALPVVPPGYSARVVAEALGVFPQAVDVAMDGTVYVAEPETRTRFDCTTGTRQRAGLAAV